jgi:octaprenyl-diphosphate synthase
LKEKKITLPLIYTLNQATISEKRKIINIIRNENKNEKKVTEVISFIHQYEGMKYAENKMKTYRDEAIEIITQSPDSIYSKSLIDLVLFSTERDK